LRRLGEEPKGESPMLHVRVTQETLKRLELLARSKGRSVSEIARNCLEECLKRKGRRS